jgi:hypothetical protein
VIAVINSYDRNMRTTSFRNSIGPAKWLILWCSIVALLGCDIVPRKVAIDDSRIQPLLAAAASFQRTAYGFTPIPKQALVRWESRPTTRYDAMLHIEGKTSRTISFKKEGSSYRWTGEQEIFEGPNKYKTEDGTFNEQVTLTFEIESVSGFPLNRLNVSYRGENPRFSERSNLTLADVTPLLKQWGY